MQEEDEEDEGEQSLGTSPENDEELGEDDYEQEIEDDQAQDDKEDE